MDIPRPSNARAKMIRKIVFVAAVILLLAGLTLGLSRLRPAAPTVDKATVWTDEVKRGPMLREVRGLGTLIPEDIRWIAAQTDSHVDRIVLRPGAIVKPDSVILELSDLQLQREALDAEYQLKGAQADYANLRVQVNSELMNQKALYQLKKSQLDALHVRAGIEGVLQLVPVEVGQHVTPGTNIARVADPKKLKAEIKIAETQEKDVTIGQKATVDTRNGVVNGHVSRIDPSVQNGTVTVDVTITDPLPQGARPDLSVDGTVTLENLKDVLYVGRPVHGQADSTIGIFKIIDDGSEAVRVNVKLGRSSVNTIEVVEGLKVGDKVILSDMSQWDNYDRIRLK